MTRGEAVNWIINIAYDIGKAEHRELWHYEQALSEIRDMLQSEPERKTGTWEVVDYQEPRRYGCSECKRLVWHGENYCPNCGARMKI